MPQRSEQWFTAGNGCLERLHAPFTQQEQAASGMTMYIDLGIHTWT
jgi:hypothetical protein